MTIIKEYVKQENGYRVILRSDGYSKTLEYIHTLCAEMKKHFDVDEREVVIVVYGGQRYAKTMGIEFDTDTKPPAGYKQIEQVEFTLA